MYFQEKRTITFIITGIGILSAYCYHVFQKYSSGELSMTGDLNLWAKSMLIFIGAGIVISIVVSIVFNIISAVINEANSHEQNDFYIEDEMDKLIELKSLRVSYILTGSGFMLSLIMLVMNKPAALMLNIMFISFSVGSIIEGFVKLYYYRKGVRNG
jgi:hypothetical protein